MIRKAVSTVSLLWLATMFSSGLAFITQIILARQLGVVEFGSFSAALATVNLLAPLAGFGVNGFWLNIFGKEGWDALRWIKPSLLFSSFSTFAVIILIIAWAMLGAHDKQSAFLLIVLSGCVISQAVIGIVSSCFHLEENYFYLSIWQFLQHGLRLIGIGVIIFVYSKPTATSVSFIYAAVVIFVVLSSVFPLSRMLRGNISLKGHGKNSAHQKFGEIAMLEMFRQSWHFGVSGFIYLIFFQSDIVLLKYLSTDKQVGLYNVAFVFMSAIYLFPSVIYQYLLPKIQRWINHDLPKLQQVYRNGCGAMLFFGLSVMIIINLSSPFLISLFFGPAYMSCIEILFILSFAIPCRYLSCNFGSFLMTEKHIAKKNIVMILAIFVNIVLNIFLLPAYGAVGAAISTVLSEVIVTVMYLKATNSYFKTIDKNNR